MIMFNYITPVMYLDPSGESIVGVIIISVLVLITVISFVIAVKKTQDDIDLLPEEPGEVSNYTTSEEYEKAWIDYSAGQYVKTRYLIPKMGVKTITTVLSILSLGFIKSVSGSIVYDYFLSLIVNDALFDNHNVDTIKKHNSYLDNELGFLYSEGINLNNYYDWHSERIIYWKEKVDEN